MHLEGACAIVKFKKQISQGTQTKGFQTKKAPWQETFAGAGDGLPFTLDLQGNHAVMSGAVTLDRLDFDIGQSLPDETSLGFAVKVQIDLAADRAN